MKKYLLRESDHEGYCEILEAIKDGGKEPDGSKWKVRFIKAGLSMNRFFYSMDVLKKAVPLFDGAKVFADHPTQTEDVERPERSIKDQVGWIEGVKPDKTGLTATFIVVAGWLKEMMLNAWKLKKKDFIEFSINAKGTGADEIFQGQPIHRVDEIDRVDSVDAVTFGAAGGEVLKLVASHGGANKEEKMIEKLLKLLETLSPEKAKELKGKKDLKDEEVMTAIQEAMKEKDQATKDEMAKQIKEAIEAKEKELKESKKKEENKGNGNGDLELKERLKKFDEADKEIQESLCKIRLTEAIQAESQWMTEPVEKKLRKQFGDRLFEKVELTEAIKLEKECWAVVAREGMVRGVGKQDVEIGDEQVDKYNKAMLGLFTGQNEDKVRRFNFLSEAAYEIAGIMNKKSVLAAVMGYKLDNHGRLREAITTTQFGEIFGDNLNKSMLKMYDRTGLGRWRDVVTIVPLKDYMTQHNIRMGGYGNLPAVSQGADYQALSTPTDEEVTWAATKRGGLETLTEEAIYNDNVLALRNIPRKLGVSASQTLFEFVFGFFSTNAALDYDSVAWFHADHSNIATGALADATLKAARLRMKKQTELDSSKAIGIIPKFIIFPNDLEDAVFKLTKTEQTSGQANWDKSAIPTWNLQPIEVPYWSDANNWFLLADPIMYPCIMLGFLDGEEEPQLLVQDLPNVGSGFDADQVTYKIKHVYGGDVSDHRPADGNVVA